MQPKSAWDWLAFACTWIGSIVLVSRSASAPLLPGMPDFLAANFWNYVPVVLVSIAGAIFVLRHFRPAKKQRLELRREQNVAAAQPKSPPMLRLTDTEREKLAKALHDVHELLVTDIQNLNRAIALHGNGITVANYADVVRTWADLSVEYERKLRKLMDFHGLIFDKVDISFSAVQNGLMKISVDIRDVRRALDWPEEALREKANALVRENGQLINNVSLAKDKIKEKRRAYLDQ